MESDVKDPTPSGGVPPVSAVEKNIADEFRSLAAEIRERQAQDAAAAKTRQDELKRVYRSGQRKGVIWGLVFCLIVGGALIRFADQVSDSNAQLTSSVKSLANAAERKTPVLDHIVCYEQRLSGYLVAFGDYVLSLVDLPSWDPVVAQRRTEFVDKRDALAAATTLGDPNACPSIPSPGD